jgi:hypothetical protein
MTSQLPPYSCLIEYNQDDTNKYCQTIEGTITGSGFSSIELNALRRIMLRDIVTVGIVTDAEQKMTWRQMSCKHNELLEKDLLKIPVCFLKGGESPEKIMPIITALVNDYHLQIDESNDSDKETYVTTQHFQLIAKEKAGLKAAVPEERIVSELRNQLFPSMKLPNNKESYLELLRLRPKMGDAIEHCKLTAGFKVMYPHEDASVAVASNVRFLPKLDAAKLDAIETDKALSKRTRVDRGIEAAMDPTFFVQGTFTFAYCSLGVYQPKDLFICACEIMIGKLKKLYLALDGPSYKQSLTYDNEHVELPMEDDILATVVAHAMWKHFGRLKPEPKTAKNMYMFKCTVVRTQTVSSLQAGYAYYEAPPDEKDRQSHIESQFKEDLQEMLVRLDVLYDHLQKAIKSPKRWSHEEKS